MRFAAAAILQKQGIASGNTGTTSLTNTESILRARNMARPLKGVYFRVPNSHVPQRLILLWRYEQGLQLGQIGHLLESISPTLRAKWNECKANCAKKWSGFCPQGTASVAAAIQECLQDIVENPVHKVSILDVIKNS